MAARPTWRGHLRLALVSCPIRLIPATSSAERVRFHKLNRATGNRLRQQMVDAETEEPVSGEDTVMGYEFEKNRYVVVDKEEVDELKVESADVIDIERVVDSSAVDWMYRDRPYLAQPDGRTGLDIFATIREAIRRKGVVGIGRTVMARRERPVLVVPCGRGLLVTTLRDPDEIREPKRYFEEIGDVAIEDRNLEMADMLLERMRGDFDLSMFEDRYQDALKELVAARMQGQQPVEAEAPQRPGNVVNLFDALKASLDGDDAPDKRPAAKAGAGKGSGTAAAAKKKPAAGAKAAAKPAAKPAAKAPRSRKRA